MDGKQRLTAISDFYEDRFRLAGLTEWPELNGRKYSELPEQVRRGIDRRYLSSIVLLHETAKSGREAERLKQLVFERINTGGEDLSPQEKRNALHPGHLNSLCIELSRYPSFCELWDIPAPEAGERAGDDWTPSAELAQNTEYRTMTDVEYVLRFFAHRQRLRLGGSMKNLDSYLTSYLISGNQFDRKTLTQLSGIFQQTSDLILETLGEGAFWLFRERRGEWIWLTRPTLVVYDPMMFAFSLFVDHKQEIRTHKDAIKDSLAPFFRENAAVFDGRKVNNIDIRRRDEKMVEYLSSFFGQTR
jgi:hypothetical protein